MLITAAYNSLEIEGKNTTSGGSYLFYQSIKIGNDTYRIIFERNNFYELDLVRQWSINLETNTTVKCMYENLGFVPFDCIYGLLGERQFEEDSITWEFLYKPMGIKKELIFNRKHNWSTSCIELKDFLTKSGIEFTVIMECFY